MADAPLEAPIAARGPAPLLARPARGAPARTSPRAAGGLQADAQSGFDALCGVAREPGPILPAFRWSHSRRRFVASADIAANARSGKKASPISPLAPGRRDAHRRHLRPRRRRQRVARSARACRSSRRPALRCSLRSRAPHAGRSISAARMIGARTSPPGARAETMPPNCPLAFAVRTIVQAGRRPGGSAACLRRGPDPPLRCPRERGAHSSCRCRARAARPRRRADHGRASAGSAAPPAPPSAERSSP